MERNKPIIIIINNTIAMKVGRTGSSEVPGPRPDYSICLIKRKKKRKKAYNQKIKIKECADEYSEVPVQNFEIIVRQAI